MFSRKRSISSIISNGCRSKRRKTEIHGRRIHDDWESRLTQETEHNDDYRHELERKINTILEREKTFKPAPRVEHVRPETNLQGRRHKGNGRWHPEEDSILLRMVLRWNWWGRMRPGDYCYFELNSTLEWNWVQEACRANPEDGFDDLPAEELEWLLYMVKFRSFRAIQARLKSIDGKDIRVEWSNWSVPFANSDTTSIFRTLCGKEDGVGTYFGMINLLRFRSEFYLRIARYAIVRPTLSEPYVIEKEYATGPIYHGELNYEGEPDGWGTQMFPDGDTYKGQWKNGKRHGKGTYKRANGDTYTGEWQYDKKHGKGTYKRANGDTYTGEWQYNKKHGEGIYTWADGSKYKGELLDGVRHGKGTYTQANGNTYTGEWQYDKKHGKGSLFEPGIGCYSGSFLYGKRHGMGRMTYITGDVYDGMWVDNVFKYSLVMTKQPGWLYDCVLDELKRILKRILNKQIT